LLKNKTKQKKEEGFISPCHVVTFSVANFHHFKKSILEKEKKDLKRKLKLKLSKNVTIAYTI